ncbi:MAG: elongation factor Ts [Candidatus Peribacteria bacterium]|nr:elongation factor Ts [Candidatus Peribacteria bacterium]
MSPVSAADVAALRARTGVSILACKQALEEANGDQEAAIDILRKKGIAGAVKKADREQHEGAIFVAEDGVKAALVLIRCETDFVARSDDFLNFGRGIVDHILADGKEAAVSTMEPKIADIVQKLAEHISISVEDIHEVSAKSVGTYVHSNRKIGVVVGLDKDGSADLAKDVAMHAAAMNPQYVKPEDVPAAAVEREHTIWDEQMKDDKKPAEIMEKIMQGKERKFREENSLISQSFVKDQNLTVKQYLGDANVTQYLRIAA